MKKLFMALVASCLLLTGCSTVKKAEKPENSENVEEIEDIATEKTECVKPERIKDTENYKYRENVYVDNEMVIDETVKTTLECLESGDIILKMEDGTYTEAVKLVEETDDGWTYVYPEFHEVIEDYAINITFSGDYENAIVYEQ